MEIELPCEVVKDLLPSYIDEVASSYTASLVKTHLAKCEACQKTYSRMKEEGKLALHSKGEDAQYLSAEGEKKLFKKINRKLNKKVRLAVILGCLGIVLAVELSQVLFNRSIKTVAISDVTVSASVYPIEDLVTGPCKERPSEGVISKGEAPEDQELYNISVPEMAGCEITLSKKVIDECGYLTYITWHSPYVLKDIKRDIQTVGDQNIMFVSGFKTTLLNNEGAQGECIIPEMELKKLDRIVYTEANGEEKTLWQNAGR